MAQLRPWLSSLCILLLGAPLSGQEADRIWGRVETVSGDVHEGYIRWDRNEGSWVDLLDGTKEIPEVNYLAWLDATDGERAVRVIELQGHRISWEEEHPDFPREVRAGIRFGHIASLTVAGRDRAVLLLRSGRRVTLEASASDLGPSLRRLGVEPPGGREVRLRWRELERVTFSTAPPGTEAASYRLHGTVEDELGRRFTGYIGWDADEILGSDVLDGEEIVGTREHEIPFERIASIEKIRRGSRVHLIDGTSLDLNDSNDVDEDNGGIQVSDPALGMIEVEWEQFSRVSFHPPARVPTYDAFDGGRDLAGTVVTREGEELTGMIRWDADEESTWEQLDGRSEGVAFTIELGLVSRIERGEAFGATVMLRDGRVWELDGSNDVDWDNKGIMVAPEDADLSSPTAWRLVPWDVFREVRFR